MKNIITILFILCFSLSSFAQVKPDDHAEPNVSEATSMDQYVGSGYMYVTLGSLFFATMALNARDSLFRKGEIEKAMAQQKVALGATAICAGTNLVYAVKSYWPFGSTKSK